MTVLGIDIGSTFIKSSILDLNTKRVEGNRSVETPDFVDSSGFEREIPMDALVAHVREMIEDAVRQHAVEGILFSVQMHGFMLFDPQGKPITNYISWQDMRANDSADGQGAAAAILRKVGEVPFIENGIRLSNTHSLAPLCCFMEQYEGDAPVHFAMMGDALIRMLTGTVPAIHSTLAASSGMYSLTAQDWNRTLIAALGLDTVVFPAVYDGQEPLAYYRTERGVELPIYTAVGDHQAAVLGTCTQDDYVVVNIGTGGQICYLDKSLHLGDYETRPFFWGRTLRALTQRPSGRSLRVLTNFIFEVGHALFGAADVAEADVWRTIETLAEQTEAAVEAGEDSGLKVDLSFFTQDGPDDGSIKSINSNNLTIGNLFYGVYDHMAEEYYDAFRKLLQDSAADVKGIVLTGGVLRKSPLLQRLIQKKLNLPCQNSILSEDTMTGLLRLALWHRDGATEPKLGRVD